MPGPLTQKGIEHNSLPLPDAWAQTVTDDLAHYWDRKAVIDQFDPCIVDDEEDLEPTWPALHYSEEEWAAARAVGDAPDDEDEFGQEWLPGYDITDDQ